MNNIFTLLRVQIKNAYKLKDEKKSTIVATVFAFIVLGVVFAIMGVGSTLLLGFAFIDKGLEREFLTIFFTTSQVIVLIFGTIMMISTLYYNRDNEYLASMPVTPQQVFFSKFLFVYLNELLLSTAFVFMIGITFGIIAGYSFVFFLLLIPVAVLLPFLPLLLSALLSIPIMYLLAFLKNKGIWTTILLIVMFVAVFALYFKFISSVATSTGGEDSESVVIIPDSAVPGIQQAARILAPVYALVGMILGTDIWLNLLIVVASFAVLFALGYILSMTAYTKGVKAQFENNKTVVSKTREYRQYSVVGSLVRMDFKEIMRQPMLAFYALFQIVFSPILIIFMGANIGDISAEMPEAAGMVQAVFVMVAMFVILLLSSSVNYTALSSFTREGQNFFMLKALPVNPTEIIRAKTTLARIVNLVGVLIALVTTIFVFHLNFLYALGMGIFMLILSDGFTHYLVYLDFKKPKLVWENVVAALKNNTNTFIAMGVMFLILLVSVGLYAVAYFWLVLGLGLEELAIMGVYWCLMIIGAIAANILFRKLLYHSAEKFYREHE